GGDQQAGTQGQRAVRGFQAQAAMAVVALLQAGETRRTVPHQALHAGKTCLQRLAEVARHHHLAECFPPVVGRLQLHPAEIAGAADVDAADRAGRRLQAGQHAQRLQRVDRGLGQAQVALVEHGRQLAGRGGLDQGHVQRQPVQGDRQAGADQAAADDHDIMRSDHRHMIRGGACAPCRRTARRLVPTCRQRGPARSARMPAKLSTRPRAMTATSQRLFVLSVLALLMAASRAHVFDHFSPPDASWAVFFVAGFALRGWGRWVFPLLMALAMGIDWMVISRQAASFWDHYCVSAASWGLVPAYGLLWAGGSWLRGRYTGASAAQAGRLLGAFLVAVVACQFITQGTFYWYSGVVAEPTVAGW